MSHMSISEIAALYGKSRKWVYNKIDKHNIGTEKPIDGQARRLQLVDFISHCGEPNGTDPHTEAQDSTHASFVLSQENDALRRRIDELEADRAERRLREERLHVIIDRQALALPPAPEPRGVLRRLRGSLTNLVKGYQ